jgi:hypothetical protein
LEVVSRRANRDTRGMNRRKPHATPTCPSHGTCPRRGFFKGGDITGTPDVMAARVKMAGDPKAEGWSSYTPTYCGGATHKNVPGHASTPFTCQPGSIRLAALQIWRWRVLPLSTVNSMPFRRSALRAGEQVLVQQPTQIREVGSLVRPHFFAGDLLTCKPLNRHTLLKRNLFLARRHLGNKRRRNVNAFR